MISCMDFSPTHSTQTHDPTACSDFWCPYISLSLSCLFGFLTSEQCCRLLWSSQTWSRNPSGDPRFTIIQSASMMFYGKQGVLFLVPSHQVELPASITHSSTVSPDVMISKYCTNLQEKMHQQHYWKMKSKPTVENLCLMLPFTFWLLCLLLSLERGHSLLFSYI